MSSIVLFGGTFDPIHNGHLFVANRVKEQLKADKVIFIPAKNPRWKEPSSSSNRLDMLRLALKDYPDFEISLYEFDSNAKINYSIDLVRHYKKTFPNDEIYFLIGFDQVEKLHDWKDIDELKDLVQIVAYKRVGYDKIAENIKRYNIKVLELEEIKTSSTAIRNLRSLDVPYQVLKYIIDYDLYFTALIKNAMNEKRYKHSVSTAFLAYKIAESNKIDPKVAFLASYLHDIAKDINKESAKKLMEMYYPEYVDYPEVCYHQFLGEFIVKNVFQIKDKNILNAIKYHTTGNKKMTRLGKLVYAADKIEPTRGYDSKEMIDLMMEDIDKGFVKVLEENKKYYDEKQFVIDTPLQIECFNYYLKKEK